MLEPSMFVGWLPSASCYTVAELRDALSHGWPATIVVPHDDDRIIGSMVDGRRIIECPNATSGRQCVDCRLCARPVRNIVAFRAHGVRRARAREIVQDAS